MFIALRRLSRQSPSAATRSALDSYAEHLVTGNREWRERKIKEDTAYFNKVGGTQHPKCLWIGCSDSRVPAEQICQVQPGDLFVHRNVANLVVSTDANLISVLQYGIVALKIPNVVVCGHYDCGGVRAALDTDEYRRALHGVCPIENWLSFVRDVYRHHRHELEELDDAARYHRLVELNVLEQCLNIFKLPFVQKSRNEKLAGEHGMPRIHAMVYDPKEGLLRRLPIDFRPYLKEFDELYGLYPTRGHI